jgi:aminoglycoside 3-N-acetyltransferase
MSEYTRSDLKAALDRLPLERDDIVFVHSNIGLFGRCEGVTSGRDLCEMFVGAITERIGPSGTLCVPAFTYSFPRGEVFSLGVTAPGLGALAEYVMSHSVAHRSMDPCYSVAAIGGRAYSLVSHVAENSFDEAASFFARFWRYEGKMLNLNFDAGSTFVHHVERRLEAPYRFDKTFQGNIRWSSGIERRQRSTIFVRYLDDALEARFEVFDAIAREQGKFVTTKLGRGEMGVISAEDTFNLIVETLPKRPWFLTKAEAMGVEPDPARFSALR